MWSLWGSTHVGLAWAKGVDRDGEVVAHFL